MNDRINRYFNEKFLICLTFVLYVAVKFIIFINYPLHYVPIHDAASYLQHSSLSLLTPDFYYQMPLTFAVFLKAFAQNTTYIMFFQCAFSIIAWWLFAMMLYKKLSSKNRLWAWAFLLFLLLFSCSIKVSLWDAQILTESLTTSLLLFYFWFYFRCIDTKFVNKYFLVGLVVVTLCLMNQRTVNAYFMFFCIPLFVFLFFKYRSKLIKMFLLFYIMAIVSCFSFVEWSVNKSEIWCPSMGTIMSGHIIYYPSAMDYFSQHGMPDSVKQKLNAWVNKRYSSAVELCWDPNLEIKNWFYQNARSLYSKYLITHPAYLLSPFSLDNDKPNNLSNSYVAITDPIKIYGTEYSSDGLNPIFLNMVLGLTYASNALIPVLFLLAIVLTIKKRKYLFNVNVFSSAYYFVILIPLFLFIWHGNTGEPGRHQLITYVCIFLTLSLWSIFLLSTQDSYQNAEELVAIKNCELV